MSSGKSSYGKSIYYAGVAVAAGIALIITPKDWDEKTAILGVVAAGLCSWLFVGAILGVMFRVLFDVAGTPID